MEELIGYKELGVVGVVVVALLFFLWKVLQHFFENYKEVVNNNIRLNESAKALSESINSGNQVVFSKLEIVQGELGKISLELKELARKDEIIKGNQHIINKIDLLGEELKKLIDGSKKKDL